ncbi:unnamed protein product [Hymenolepis diminuta]|uniref:Uncharacterized protein n=1 Tax=Hymenolepis diminuta TaxID=6216 RepID=A0A0R3SH53_HYMDI|nr:unnamed protein product [Hymenolepis diminuta]
MKCGGLAHRILLENSAAKLQQKNYTTIDLYEKSSWSPYSKAPFDSSGINKNQKETLDEVIVKANRSRRKGKLWFESAAMYKTRSIPVSKSTIPHLKGISAKKLKANVHRKENDAFH